jgi:hypothetical protein
MTIKQSLVRALIFAPSGACAPDWLGVVTKLGSPREDTRSMTLTRTKVPV